MQQIGRSLITLILFLIPVKATLSEVKVSINLHNSQINYVTFNQVDFNNANLQNIYPYSSSFSTASLDNSLRNSCFADNIIDRELNQILKSMRESNFILEPIIEWFIMIIC